MSTGPLAVAKLVYLNGGELVGNTRMQKSVYLLREAGAGLEFDFDYHHYGPYSEDLSLAAKDAGALKYIECDWRSTAVGDPFATYRTSPDYQDTPSESDDRAAAILGVLGKYNSLTLELAATADYLEKNGFSGSEWDETMRRKPSKSSDVRISDARELLGELRRM